MARYAIDRDRSTVLVGARSSMGPITFEARDVTGTIDAEVEGTQVRAGAGTNARIEIALDSLHSGNELYDAELRRRIDARRHPRCALALERIDGLADDRFSLVGRMEFHGTSRPITGTVEVTVPRRDLLVVVGEKSVDIRDFDLPAPSILLLKIYPEVRVHLFVEARLETPGGARVSTLFGFVVGYVVGARAGSDGFAKLEAAWRDILDSEEFHNFVDLLKGHAKGTVSTINDRLQAGDGPSMADLEDLASQARARLSGADE